jgi:cell wall-associated NlpC family hydrolase
MLDRRVTRPVVVLSAALLMSPCLAAGAAPNPTPSQLRAAHDKVAQARRQVAGLQVRAERAAEAYNGARTAAQKAARVAQQAKAAAGTAQQAHDAAQAAAVRAQADADAASAQAVQALADQQRAEATAAAAQRTLDRMAVGAWQTGGVMGMAAQLFVAKDPGELANGRKLMNQVGAYQNQVVVAVELARDQAKTAAAQSATAEEAAVGTAQRATAALEAASQAKAEADSARQAAATAASTTHRRLVEADSAKRYALSLVHQAEAALGGAVRTAAQLEQAAAAARAAARAVTIGKTSSQAAATAIHWAYQQIGTPYSWGGGDENGPTYGFAQGAGTKGFDCSGLTLFAYGKAGIHLDHYTGSQWDEGKRISSRSDLEPGDLMFFAYDTTDPSTIHHVSIYLGNGKMIEAPQTGDVVKVSSADRSDFIGGTRPWQS